MAIANAAIGTTVWKINPKHSTVEFAVKHMMVATTKGQFTDVEGTITLDEANWANSSVDVEIDAASITTRDAQRDGHLKSPDFLDVATFPKLTFTSTKVEHAARRPADDRRRPDHPRRHPAGRPRHRPLRAGRDALRRQDRRLQRRDELHRADFGLMWNVALETGGVLVSDSVKVSIEIEAVRQG